MPELFTYKQIDNILVVMLHGDPFNYRHEVMRNGYNEVHRRMADEGVDNLVFDFTDFGHFDSNFIGVLVSLSQKIRLNGGLALLCSLTPTMIEVLDHLMLLENVESNFFPVPHPDLASALQRLTQSNPTQ